MGRLLSEDEWAQQLSDYEHTAFRFEQQPEYWEPSEEATINRFLAGDPEPPDAVPGLRAWFEQVAHQVAEGKRITRVRVHDNPPTAVQRWLRSIDAWNTQAGETMRYLTRRRAHEIGLLPNAGRHDWWLFDSCRLVVMRFDDRGHRIENELITDSAQVVQACARRDLALHHAAADPDRAKAS